jgi:hypothetical protein
MFRQLILIKNLFKFFLDKVKKKSKMTNKENVDLIIRLWDFLCKKKIFKKFIQKFTTFSKEKIL